MNEQEFIEYVKPILKLKGFKKNHKRWLKDIGDFTISFLIQGSAYEKDNFYIRPGVYINLLNNIKNSYYGDFYCDITSSHVYRNIKQSYPSSFKIEPPRNLF